MDVGRLELLRELRDRGSIRAVAEATHRSTSAVSQQLGVLEREAGLPLTERAGRGLRLTDAGRTLADSADRISLAMAESQAVWDEFRNTPSGSVSVAIFPSAARLLLPALMAALEHRPELAVNYTDVLAREREFLDLTADADIVIAHSGADAPVWQDTGLAVVPLLVEPFDIALPTGHPLAGQPTVTPSELADETWIGIPTGFPYHGAVERVQQASGRAARVRQRFADFSITEQLVATGQGIAALPRHTTNATRADRFALVPLIGVSARRHIVALARPEKAARLAVREVLVVLSATTARWR